MNGQEFVQSWTELPEREVGFRLLSLNEVRAKRDPTDARTVVTWEITNEIRPADLFCYLGARFGAPNGFQNFLRADHSDNLYHWEWTVDVRGSMVNIAGMNFRTEIHAIDVKVGEFESISVDEIAAAIREDIPNYGREMGELRKKLEHWVEFLNPYRRIRDSLTQLLDDLRALHLPTEHGMDQVWSPLALGDAHKQWAELAGKYTTGLGLCFGVRSMLPVLAESFVNMLMYMLMRPEIRSDQRLRENLFRQPIDVRVKSLPVYCSGFEHPIDYSSKECGDFHTLMNERNDLLHGNIAVDKLKFNDLYFWGKVPVFKEYRTMWDRTIGIEVRVTGLQKLEAEVAVVDSFIEYILGRLSAAVREKARFVLKNKHLGLNQEDGRLGCLFGDVLVDARAAGGTEPIRSTKPPVGSKKS